jgi:hypothetical protein
LLVVLSEQLFGVVADLLADVRVTDVEVVVAGDDVLDADFPGLLGLDAGFEAVFLGAPPVDLGLELLEAHGLGFVVAGDAFWIGVLVEPDFFGGGLFALGFLGEEEDVSFDAGVGIEDAVGLGQLNVEWTRTIEYGEFNIPDTFKINNTPNILFSPRSGSLILTRGGYPPDNPLGFITSVMQISSSGQVVGQFELKRDWDLVMAGSDWVLVQSSGGITQMEYRVADKKGGYRATPFPYPPKYFVIPHDELTMIEESFTAGPYLISETTESITIQKLSVELQVTGDQPNSVTTPTISRTTDGVSISTDTEDGQSYRIQSSQDLKQWRDEEIIEGNGEKKSVQRQTDKPKEFLRVVEE